MKIGERIKALRKERGLSVESVASKLGVSPSTLYRYENGSIEKLPVEICDELCKVYQVRPEVLRGDVSSKTVAKAPTLPDHFDTAEEAMQWLLQMPMLAAYGEYDLSTMSQETIVQFANEILAQLRLVAYKYR